MSGKNGKSDTGPTTVDDLYNAPRIGESSTGDRYSGMTRKLEAAEQRIGRAKDVYDKRKFNYDVIQAIKDPDVPWHVVKADRLEAADAGEKLHHIHKMYGIERENPSIIRAFDNALFFCHTINSGSVLQPDRSWLLVRGDRFSFLPVITYLGTDLRRFFRAFAEEIKEVNKAVLDDYDPYDVNKAEKHSWLLEVAMDRGLMRFPYLAHDSSDKCALTPVERAAVSVSKTSVFGSIINAPDRFNSNSRGGTSDDFDSTNLKTVPTKGSVQN